jgi:hypothetical protein
VVVVAKGEDSDGRRINPPLGHKDHPRHLADEGPHQHPRRGASSRSGAPVALVAKKAFSADLHRYRFYTTSWDSNADTPMHGVLVHDQEDGSGGRAGGAVAGT